MQVDKLK